MKLPIALIVSIVSTQAFAIEASCGNGRVSANGSNVRYIDNNGNSIPVYDGKYSVKSMASCNGGVVTVFKGEDQDVAYFSPDCLFVGGGGRTKNVFQNDHRNEGLVTHPTGVGVFATWRHKDGGNAATYHSPDCLNLGGGGNTVNSGSRN
ncbi:hypothetical protein [Roseibium album]|uniref:hypothetical protein n=1 Tax=Roseibium album TaxID=311410 RepID=UPI003296FD2B